LARFSYRRPRKGEIPFLSRTSAPGGGGPGVPPLEPFPFKATEFFKRPPSRCRTPVACRATSTETSPLKTSLVGRCCLGPWGNRPAGSAPTPVLGYGQITNRAAGAVHQKSAGETLQGIFSSLPPPRKTPPSPWPRGSFWSPRQRNVSDVPFFPDGRSPKKGPEGRQLFGCPSQAQRRPPCAKAGWSGPGRQIPDAVNALLVGAGETAVGPPYCQARPRFKPSVVSEDAKGANKCQIIQAPEHQDVVPGRAVRSCPPWLAVRAPTSRFGPEAQAAQRAALRPRPVVPAGEWVNALPGA